MDGEFLKNHNTAHHIAAVTIIKIYHQNLMRINQKSSQIKIKLKLKNKRTKEQSCWFVICPVIITVAHVRTKKVHINQFE